METFSSLVNKVALGGFLSRHRVGGRGRGEMLISYLLFVDDTLVFCGDSRDQMMYLKWILLLFEILFGQRINLDKSSMIPMGDVESPEVLAKELGCNVNLLPTTYLVSLLAQDTNLWQFGTMWRKNYVED